MAGWMCVLAVLGAVGIGVAELHQAAGRYWTMGGPWAVALLVSDSLAAIALMAGLQHLVPHHRVPFPATIAWVVLTAASGARFLYLVPAPGNRRARKRVTTVRRYAVDQVKDLARIASLQRLLDVVEPAALLLPDRELTRLATLFLEAKQRAGELPPELPVESFINSIMSDSSVTRRGRVRSLLRVLVDHGGERLCQSFVTRAKTRPVRKGNR